MTMTHATLVEWLDLDLDGELGAQDKRLFERHLAQQSEATTLAATSLERERRALENLHSMMNESKVEVADDFTDSVMASLPAASWEATSTSAWRLPLALMLFFALGAAITMAGVSADHPLIGTGGAMLDFMQTTVLAGAGIAVAAWRGAGMGLEELMATSTANLAAFAVLVLCVNLLFLSLLRRRKRPSVTVESGSNPTGSR